MIESAFRSPLTELRKLYDTLLALRLTVVEDKPARGDAH